MTNDKAFRAWIETLPSCLDGNYSEYVNGQGRNIACHVRRASNSGTAYKPEYSCIPLTREQHNYQHQHGELACLVKYGYLMFDESQKIDNATNVIKAKQWFDDQAEYYRKEWEKINGN